MNEKTPRCGTCLVFGHDDAQCPKRIIVELRNLGKQGQTSNDDVQTVQRKGVRDPLVSKHDTRGDISIPKQHVPKSVYQKKTTSTPVSNSFSALDLVDGKRKKVRAPPRKTDIWLGRKTGYSSNSGFTSPNPFDVLMKEDGKITLSDFQESGDGADVDDDTTTSSKSFGNPTGGNT
nr:hypothetical protein [Tanacetum cinerariifolium]